MLTLSKAAEVLDFDSQTGIFRWKVCASKHIRPGDIAGHVNNSGYRTICINHRKHGAHRLAWLFTHGEFPVSSIDHINGDRLDNRPENLRCATYGDNQQNRSLDSRNKSGFTGVTWDKGHRKWRAKICIDRKQITIGVFSDLSDAVAARRRAKQKFHTFNPFDR